MLHEISEIRQLRGNEEETGSDLAEAYVLGQLSAEREQQYEAHLLMCGSCRQDVEQISEFIHTLRLASEGIDPLPLWTTLAGKL